MTDETTTTQAPEQNLTDSPHYLAQTLMANGIKNMYGVVGIPVTDFARIAQGMGMRYIGMDRLRPRLPQWARRHARSHHQWFPGHHDRRFLDPQRRRHARRRIRGPRPDELREGLLQGILPHRQDRGHPARRGPRHAHRLLRPPGRRLPRLPGCRRGADDGQGCGRSPAVDRRRRRSTRHSSC